MAGGLKREDSEDPFADLLAASYEASPGSRRQLDGASVAMGDESAQGGLGVLSSAAATAADRGGRRDTIGVGRAVETPGGPDHRAADAADRQMLEAYRELVSPAVYRRMADLTGAIIAQRHAGDDDMVAFLRESMKVLMRDGMSRAGEARTGVATPPPASVGGFTFPVGLSARDADLLASFASHVSQSALLTTGLPVITLASKPDDVFALLGGLLDDLSKVRPNGALAAHAITQCAHGA
jgi:hypothetical protein